MEHPITPPPELVRQWCAHSNEHENYEQFWRHIATQAARWGADQELGQCVAWLDFNYPSVNSKALRTDRRPVPPSLKQQALEALDEINEPLGIVTATRCAIIRQALESLPDAQD